MPNSQKKCAITSLLNKETTKIPCQWENCTRTFADPQVLYDHLCNDHVGRKSNKNLALTCKWAGCTTSTSKRDHITSHLRVHVPLKPYACQQCEKRFKRPQDLKKHKRTHVNSEIRKRQKLFYDKLSLLTPVQKAEFIRNNFNLFEEEPRSEPIVKQEFVQPITYSLPVHYNTYHIQNIQHQTPNQPYIYPYQHLPYHPTPTNPPLQQHPPFHTPTPQQSVSYPPQFVTPYPPPFKWNSAQ